MKRILSVLLALVMIVGMIPMSILSASAAEVTETVSVIANTGVLASDSLSISWTSNDVTFTNLKNESTNAIRTSDSDHFRAYAGSAISITAPGNITKIVVTCTSSSYASALVTAAGSEASASSSTVTIVPTASAAEYSVAKLSAQVRLKTVAVSYATVDSSECTHTNTETIAAVAATCTTAGNTEGTKCADCGVILSGNETIAALGHSNDEGVVTAPTCTEDGYTTYTCTVCGSSAKSDWVDATGHTYVDGTCSACGVEKPAALDGKYYIAAIRSSGNYQYMTNDLGTASTKRYQAVDSGLTELPASIETTVDAQVFELIASGDGYKIKIGDQYLGYTSGNSGALVAEADAKVVTIENGTEGAYVFHFTVSADDERYLALNNTATSNYFAWYKGAGNQIQDLYLVPVSENAEACTHANTTVEGKVDATCTTAGSTGAVVCSDCGATVTEATVIEALGHTYAEGVCSVCGEAEPAEDANIVFELGDNGTASHSDGSSATTYSETVDEYTLTLTASAKMYTGAVDATGNGCIKLGTGSAAGGFSFTVPDNVTAVVINVAGYKANTAKISINSGDTQTISTCSNNGEYTAIEIDTSTTKTISFTTVSGGYRAMVNSIAFICGETDHTCVWDEGVITTAATCTTEGVLTYTCTVDGCTKTEAIAATGHTYVYGESAITCSACDYNAAYTLSTIAEAKAYTDTTAVYYVKGIVTYVSGKNVYIEDATGAICVYYATAPSDIVLGDEILVWDTMTTYKGLIETTNTTSQEYVKVSSGNTLPSQTVTIADLLADTTNEYLAERVVIENVTMGVINTSGNTPLTDGDGNSISLYKVSGLNEAINVNDVVTATVIVSTYDAYQLLVNPGTAADDVVEVEHHDEVVIETITIAEAKAGTAGEYYQVEGVVTFIDGRNVYIQDATGGIVVYLTTNNTTAAIGDKIKAYGQLKQYNGLIELDGIAQDNTDQFEVLSNGNTVDAQTVTVADVANDTTNEYLAEKIVLNNVYVSYSYGYSSSYANVNYVLKDGDATVVLYRVPAATEADVMAGGTIINVEAIVSSYNGYQLRVVGVESVTVVGTCAHETTNLVNVAAATCTEAGYTGDTECAACGNYTARGTEIAALGHSFTENGTCANGCGTQAKIVMNGEYYTSFDDANAAFDGHPMKLLANIGEDGAVQLTQNIYVDLFGFTMNAYAADANGYTVFGMDSTTDSHEAEEWGYLKVTGTAKVAPVTNNSYLAVDEGELGWSFHAFSVKLTHVSLKADADALGYKAQFQGDEMVQSKVTGFGFNLWVTTNNVITKSQATAANEEIITLRLQGIMAANGGAVPVFAEAFVTFDGVEDAVKTNPYNTTMKDTIETIETQLELGATAYTAEQIKSIQGLIEKYESKMSGWNIDTIKAWTEA